jgi:ABC-type branched-subunit amino acid transport system ATPase component
VLQLQNVTVAYGTMVAVEDVSISMGAGEIVALIGPNGAGKSSLVNAIGGLVRVKSGRVEIDGVDLTDASAAQRVRQGLSRTFQTPRMERWLTVEEQLAAQSPEYGYNAWLGRNGFRTQLRETLEEFGLLQMARRTASTLTLGELRAFEFARALVRAPKLLLVDEPASGMSAEEAGVLARSLVKLRRSGVAILVVEHNIPFVRGIASRVVVLAAGRVIADGETSDVLQSDLVKEAYLGHSHP